MEGRAFLTLTETAPPPERVRWSKDPNEIEIG
jgi:hypothetical protein